jgi:D-glycero-alpha-D-manno-heptose 1-phosphate guanylyltransferase
VAGQTPVRTAVVLAGGQGTRIRHLLPDLPKPLAPVAGRPFLEWVVRYLRRQGVARIVLSTGHHAEKVEAFAGGLVLEGVSIDCVGEPTPLGTAGGFLHAYKAVPDSAPEVLVCNGDSLVLAELAPLFASLGAPDVDAALLAVTVNDASRYGTVDAGDGGFLRGFAEKRSGAGHINGGCYLFRRSVIGRFPDGRPLSFEYDVFPALISGGARIKVVPCEAAFLDIGTESSLAQASGFIEDNMRWFE